MIRFNNSNVNFLGVRIATAILPFLTKAIIYCLRKVRFFCKRKSVAKKSIEDIENFFETMPLFDYVEIETINKCNSTCSFCPINRDIDPRPLAKMGEDTFRKIIDNLAGLNFCGNISYYSNNEPLMDNRIADFIKYGVSKIPNATHHLLSNGTLLTEEKFQTLIDSGLNFMVINNYNDKLKLNPNIQKIYDKYKEKDFPLNCAINRRFKNQYLSKRGGAAPNRLKTAAKPLNGPCYWPFRQFIIRADCGVSLCCNDALGKITLGNVEKQTLEDIWFGEKHLNILKSIRENWRDNIEICKACDVIASKNDLVSG